MILLIDCFLRFFLSQWFGIEPIGVDIELLLVRLFLALFFRIIVHDACRTFAVIISIDAHALHCSESFYVKELITLLVKTACVAGADWSFFWWVSGETRPWSHQTYDLSDWIDLDERRHRARCCCSCGAWEFCFCVHEIGPSCSRVMHEWIELQAPIAWIQSPVRSFIGSSLWPCCRCWIKTPQSALQFLRGSGMPMHQFAIFGVAGCSSIGCSRRSFSIRNDLVVEFN